MCATLRETTRSTYGGAPQHLRVLAMHRQVSGIPQPKDAFKKNKEPYS